MHDNNLSKLKLVFKILGTLLVAFGSIAVVVGLGRWGVSYYWFLISPIFGIAFYMLAPRSWRFASILKYWFPVANELIHRQEQIDLNISVVEKMAYTLRFYDLPDIDKIEDLRSRLINSLPEVETESGRLESCAKNTVKLLKGAGFNLPYKALMLLYQDHHSSPPVVLWEKEKTSLIPDVAEVLRRSTHLQSRQYEDPYRKKDVERLLLPLQAFTLKKVKEEVESLNDVWSIAADYLRFLTEHDVRHQTKLESPGDLLGHLMDGELPIDADNLNSIIIRLLRDVGIQAIGSTFPDLSKEMSVSFCRISLILFLMNVPETNAKKVSEMSGQVCREAGADEVAVRIAFAYLEFKEDLRTRVKLDGKRFVSVNYLVCNWTRKVAEKEKSLLEGFQKELVTIRETLQAGNWVTSLSYIIQETFDKLKGMDSKLDDLVAERPLLARESLRRVFKNLKLETVERYLEARTINAYLITFRSEEGSVAYLLKCLVTGSKQTRLQQLGISTKTNDLPTYNYKQYTNHGRIGIVPRGLSFEEFQKVFQKDLEKVVNARRELIPLPSLKPKSSKQPEDDLYWDWDAHDLKDIELIVHHFGLSGRNYFGFIKEGITKAYAIEKIKELFAGILSDSDLRALINYEKDEISIVEAIIDGPLIELIADRVMLSPVESKVLRNTDQRLRDEIFGVCGCGNAKALGQYLLESDRRKMKSATRKATGKLVLLLVGTAPAFDDAKCRLVAEAYLETVRAIAGITA